MAAGLCLPDGYQRVDMCDSGCGSDNDRGGDGQRSGDEDGDGESSEKPPGGVGHLKTITMLKNYFKVAWRNLQKSRISSFINISGLAVGMAVAMLKGL